MAEERYNKNMDAEGATGILALLMFFGFWVYAWWRWPIPTIIVSVILYVIYITIRIHNPSDTLQDDSLLYINALVRSA